MPSRNYKHKLAGQN